MKAFENRRIAVNGIDMNVVIAGDGPPVLLVHGYPDDHTVWRHQLPALVKAGYRVIAPDTRGCGETGISPNVVDYRIENLVADLVGLLDALGIDKVRLVAHDWGAVISWHLAIAHPERVDRYLALSVGHPSTYGQGGLAQKLKGSYILFFQLRGIAEFLLRFNNWSLFDLVAGYPEEHAHWHERLSRPGRLTAGINYYRANFRRILASGYREASVPVFGIWSRNDRFLTERQMLDSQRLVEGPWRYARLDNANHWIPLSAPQELEPLLLDYLQ
jgi:pimeloyl-ACP methyl ester carboxylesterase